MTFMLANPQNDDEYDASAAAVDEGVVDLELPVSTQPGVRVLAAATAAASAVTMTTSVSTWPVRSATQSSVPRPGSRRRRKDRQ
jgi:hypothetical protein